MEKKNTKNKKKNTKNVKKKNINEKKKNTKDKILVEIAAYCDPELLNTVHSAIIQADDPKRVNFVVCYQSDNMDDLNELKKIKNCKIIHMSEKDSKGCCYARYLCQKEIKDEKYIYSIDSHMRFVKHWDTKMIELLESIGDKKAILSYYPPSCTEEMMSLPLDDPMFDKPAYGGFMYANGFSEPKSYFLELRANLMYDDKKLAFKRNAFISGGNFFSYSEAHKEVLNDKNMFFLGDELAMAVRFFTYGWNVYNPPEGYIYHKYERKDRKFPTVTNSHLNECERLRSLLDIGDNKVDLGEFGLGKVRTLKEFEEFSGVDFKNRIIHMSSETGEYDNPSQKDKINYFQRKKIDREKLANLRVPIYVVIFDRYNDYQECIRSCIRNSRYPSNLIFLVASTLNEEDNNKFNYRKFVKKFIHVDEYGVYGRYLSKLCESLNDGFVAVVESSFRFIKGWDVYYSDNLKKFDLNGVLTSWVWKSNEQKEDFPCYKNVIKEYNGFNGYLPGLRYNEGIDMINRNKPLQTGFISDGFMFCQSTVLKKVLPDPNLSYFEHTFTYSVRLWTSGINIYYSNLSYLIRFKEDYELNEKITHYDITSCILGLDNMISKTVEERYRYDNGNVRPLWTWYEFIGEPNYEIKSFMIPENK